MISVPKALERGLLKSTNSPFRKPDIVSDGDAIQKNVVYRVDFVLFLTHLSRLLRVKPRPDAISSGVRSRLFSLSQPTTQPSLSSIQEQCRVYISAK